MVNNILSFEDQIEIERRVGIQDAADNWKEKSRILKNAEEDEKLAREALIEACEGEDFEGEGVKVAQITRKGAVEYKAIPELAGVNLESYRKEPSVYWTVKPSVKE